MLRRCSTLALLAASTLFLLVPEALAQPKKTLLAGVVYEIEVTGLKAPLEIPDRGRLQIEVDGPNVARVGFAGQGEKMEELQIVSAPNKDRIMTHPYFGIMTHPYFVSDDNTVFVKITDSSVEPDKFGLPDLRGAKRMLAVFVLFRD